MAIEITEEMAESVNTALANRVPCLLATAGADGWPSMGYRGSMMVFDDANLAYWERSYKDGIAHIRENPQVLVMFRNPETRQAWKFYGTATIHEAGDTREAVWDKTVEQERNADPEKKGFGVVIALDRITNYGGAVMSEK